MSYHPKDRYMYVSAEGRYRSVNVSSPLQDHRRRSSSSSATSSLLSAASNIRLPPNVPDRPSTLDIAMAQSIKNDTRTNAEQLARDDALWKDFKKSLNTSGTVTNLAAREMLRESLLKSKCYQTEKIERAAEEEQAKEKAASSGFKRVISALSFEGLALESESIDLSEQHVIMSEIMNRRRSSISTNLSAISGTDVPTVAQVLANSLGNSVRRVSGIFNGSTCSKDEALNSMIPTSISTSNARSSSVSTSSRRSSIESASVESACTSNSRRRRMSSLRMSFLAFDDVFDDVEEMSDEDSTSESDTEENCKLDQKLAAKLQAAEIQEELCSGSVDDPDAKKQDYFANTTSRSIRHHQQVFRQTSDKKHPAKKDDDDIQESFSSIKDFRSRAA